MIINGSDLLIAAPIADMLPIKVAVAGKTRGLGEAGYDICIQQEVLFYGHSSRVYRRTDPVLGETQRGAGRFCLASAKDLFQMPQDLVGYVKDKSSWARLGLSVFNTVIEPGWHGYLTLELVYHGEDNLLIPAGAPIAQVVFHQTSQPACYTGRYNNQPAAPVAAIEAKAEKESHAEPAVLLQG